MQEKRMDTTERDPMAPSDAAVIAWDIARERERAS